MKNPRSIMLAVAIATIFTVTVILVRQAASGGTGDGAVMISKPALTVVAITPQPATLPIRITANGNIMAWQEASIGTEANGLRLVNVKVAVGDIVQRGQVLATFASETVMADLAQSGAAVAEAEASLAEAKDSAQRARELQTTGAMSAQQIHRYLIAERTARARLVAMQAAEKKQRLGLAQAQVLAPDDGVISASSATVGAVLPAGQELFRLIRQGRLEWRAEVAASELARLRPGQLAQVTPVSGETIKGRVRSLAPTVDLRSRNGLAYVDLPADTTARVGMFARGEFEIGSERMMSLPQSAVLSLDGFNYVMRIGPGSKLIQSKVTTGRRAGDRVEIIAGIKDSDQVVESGVAFLGDGDLVRVFDGTEADGNTVIGSAR
jgi:RND family efflux transporter MFP subunit